MFDKIVRNSSDLIAALLRSQIVACQNLLYSLENDQLQSNYLEDNLIKLRKNNQRIINFIEQIEHLAKYEAFVIS